MNTDAFARLLVHAQMLPLFLLCLPTSLHCIRSFCRTHFAGASQADFLGLPHGIKLPTREAGGQLSIATSHRVLEAQREVPGLTQGGPCTGGAKSQVQSFCSQISCREEYSMPPKIPTTLLPLPFTLPLGHWAEGE